MTARDLAAAGGLDGGTIVPIRAAAPDPGPVLEPLSSWGDDILATHPPPVEWLIRRRVDDADRSIGFLERGVVGGIAGPGGVGKSSLVLQLLLGIACGRNVVGPLYPTQPGHVLYACTEERREHLQRRLHFAARAMRLDAAARAEAASRFVPLVLHGECPTLLDRSAKSGALIETAFSARLLDRAAGYGVEWSLVIFDTLSRFGPADVEVDNGAAAAFIANLERFARLPGTPTVLYVHHTRKGGTGSVDDVRGAGALVANARWLATMRATDGIDGCVLGVKKHNNSPRQHDLYLARDENLETSLREMSAAEQATAEGGRR